MKKTFMIALLGFISWNTNAQDINLPIELPNIVPPAPTAYELGKFGEIPIGLFTGTPNVNVPIMEFSAGSLKVPISLNYSSNGIKVDQLEGNVGLGWNLNAGGLINRTVVGYEDENRAFNFPFDVSNNYVSTPWLEYFFYQAGGSIIDRTQVLKEKLDSEPDLYNYNFLGRSGRLIYNDQKELIVLNDPTLKLGNTKLSLIDELGNKYFFEDEEQTQTSINISNNNNPIPKQFVTAWYLTRIESPQGDQIFFEYIDEEAFYLSMKSQSITVASPQHQRKLTGGTESLYFPPKINYIETYSRIFGKKLAKIYSNNPSDGSINFEYQKQHSDPEITNTYSTYNLLTKITKSSNSNKTIEETSFDYLTSKNHRMFLKKVNYLDPSKTYEFEYIEPESCPTRLSYSKDYWGYYNGKDGRYLFPKPSSLYFRSRALENQVNYGADRNINETAAKAGLLKKVIYPTKGSSTFSYESNVHRDSKAVYELTRYREELYTKGNNTLGLTKKFRITSIPNSQSIPFNISLSDNYRDCTENNFPSPEDKKLLIQITNLTKSQENIIKQEISNGAHIVEGNFLTYDNSKRDLNYKFLLLENNEYEITMKVNYQCLYAKISFDVQGTKSYEYFNQVTGGLRIGEVKNFDLNNDFLNSKKYYYAKKDQLDISSGIKPKNPIYVTTSYSDNQKLCEHWTWRFVSLNSGSTRALYDSSVQNTRYQYVTVSQDGEDFNNGGIEHQFKIANKDDGRPVLGNYSNHYPQTDIEWGDGLELQKTYFKKDGTTFKNSKKEIKHYSLDDRVNDIIHGFKISRQYEGTTCTLGENVGNGLVFKPIHGIMNKDGIIDVSRYEIKNNWFYLDSFTIENYDINGINPVTSVKRYFYDNNDHAQLTRTETTDSRGFTINQVIKYPQDIHPASATEQLLIDENRIALPIETTKKVLDENQEELSLSKQYNQYSTFYLEDKGDNSSSIRGVPLLSKIKSSKNNQSYEDRIEYNDYMNSGKPNEVSLEDGIHIVYIWGYDEKYPIAKIENATFSEVSETLGKTETQLKDFDESDLSSLNSLRNLLPNAMITTYTYEPLIGITSVTDPKGYTITYHYDTFNRLQFIKDAAGNLVSENKYNYKN